jgi:hemerythrin superfamily protein
MGTRTQRRKTGNSGKIEVNDAIGGRKQVSNTGRVQEQTINMYTNIHTGMDNKYYFTAGRSVNIQSMLNDEQEFLDMRKRALEYKIVQIAVNFNYNYIPTPGSRFPKMIITPETDTVLEVADPQKNRNAMVWDMTRIGNKNFNFRITRQNTEMTNREWQNGAAQWAGIAILHISEISEVQSDSNINLGDVKISVQVLYRPLDTVLVYNKNHISDKEAINMLKQKLIKEKEEKEMQQKLEQFKNEKLNKSN